MSRTSLLILGAVIVLGLALVLMYLNPGEQVKNRAQQIEKQPPGQNQEPPKTELPKNPESPKNTTGEQTPKKQEDSKEVPPSTEYSQKVEIASIEALPANKLVALEGRLAVVVTVKNPTDEELVGQTVALLLDGKPFQRRSIDLKPGATGSVYFTIEGIKPAGPHEIQVNQQKFSITAFDVASAIQRPKSLLPDDPKFVGAAQGVTSIGLPGGALVLPVRNGPRTLNPVIATDPDTIEITRQLHGFLVERNPLTGEPEPGLATSWEFSADRRTIKLYLRKGVKFSDGKEFTADDVVFTFSDVLFNPDIAARESESFRISGSFISVQKLDTYLVQLELAVPFQPLLISLAGPAVLPKHLLESKVAKLHPSAGGYWSGAKSLIEEKQDELQKLAVDTVTQLNKALAELEDPIDRKNFAGVEKGAKQAIQLIETLKSSVKENALQAMLDRVKGYLIQAMDAAQGGQFEGISPLLFDQTWSVGEAREHPENLTGLGPFVFKSYDPQQRVQLERNPAYWKVDEKGLQLPYVDRLVLQVLPSPDTAMTRFQKDDLDLYEARPQDWAKLKADASVKNWTLLGDQPPGGLRPSTSQDEFLAFNFDTQNTELQKTFRDVRFRRAIAYATDHQRIVSQIYSGLADTLPGAVEFSLEKAKALLDEMGLKETSNDGVRKRSDGQPLSFTIVVNQENDARVQVAQLYAETLKQLGIRVTVQPVEYDAFVPALLSGQFEAALVGLSRSPELYFSANVWKSEGALHFWHRSAKADPFDWERQIDQLFERASQTFGESALEKIDEEIQRLSAENLPVILTATPRYLVAFKQPLANAESINPYGEIWALTDRVWWRDENRRFQ